MIGDGSSIQVKGNEFYGHAPHFLSTAMIIPLGFLHRNGKKRLGSQAAFSISHVLKSALLVLEGAAFRTALRGNIPTAAAYANILSLAAIVTVMSTALHFALNVRLNRGVVTHGVLSRTGLALLIRGTASLAALLSGRSVHLNAHQTALVVLKMLTAGHLTFQTVHTRHLVFAKFLKSVAPLSKQ